MVPDNTQIMQQLGKPMTPVAPNGVAANVNDVVNNTQAQVLSYSDARQDIISQFEREVNAELCKVRDLCTLPADMTTPPASSPLVQLDGTTLGDPALTSAACGAMAKAIVTNGLIDWTIAYQQAAGWVVLQQLLYEQAQVDGNVASDADVSAAAQQQLNVYVNDPNPNKPQIAQGQTAAEVFTSPNVLAGRKIGMSISLEKRYLLQTALGSHYSAQQASQFILGWFTSQLASHTVQVSGLPAFDMSQVLPAGTM